MKRSILSKFLWTTKRKIKDWRGNMLNLKIDKFALGDLAEETGFQIKELGDGKIGFSALVGNAKITFFARPGDKVTPIRLGPPPPMPGYPKAS